MSDIAQLYPPSPTDIPADLTTPSASYRLRVILVLSCLIVFVIVYLGLVIGTAGLSVYCFAQLGADEPPPPPVTYSPSNYKSYSPSNYKTVPKYVPPSKPARDRSPFWFLVGGIASGLLCLFLAKGLFRISRSDQGVRLEVTENDQPILFAFIKRLCQETGSPFPHRIYLVPDVNAAVAYHQSVLSLIFPTRKNLIIGLGLVNRLNLTEFKAVLAHEFGHFSQNSMKLGTYVYTSNRVIIDVVYGRGKLDQFVSALRGTDVRIAVFAWAFSAVLWVLRKGLELLFRGINFAHTSLSRQMEYNADLVAVSVTGSDALVFALARLDFASDSLSQGWADLTTAADHSHFSRDLYFHQTRAAEFLKARRNDPNLGEVPTLPDDPHLTVQVFKPEDTGVPKMWATHPSNHDRETNAKSRYCRGPVDARSAWELFANPSSVRESMTRLVYATTSREIPETLETAEDVQAFIDAEHAETTYHPRYHGLYDDRYVKPGKMAELCVISERAEFDDRGRLADAHAQLYGEDLKSKMDAYKTRNEELVRLSRMASGMVQLTGKDFEHRGRRFSLAQVPRLLKEVEKEIDNHFENMHALDRLVFRVHYAMAVQLGETERAELEERYHFHLTIQEIHLSLVANSRHVDAVLSSLSGQQEVSQSDFQAALNALREAHTVLEDSLNMANRLAMPALTNVTAGQPLRSLLRTEPIIRKLHADIKTLNGEWIGKFMGQMREVIEKTARILFKSLGGLLALQERIAERWLAMHNGIPESPVSETVIDESRGEKAPEPPPTPTP
jgi:Zn-dependent protease with chaperone function